MDACEYSLVLKLAEDLTKEDWMDIFKAGLKDYPEVLDASVEYKIHKNSEIVRLYNPDYGFSCVVPKSTVVSFSLPTLQFSSVFKFNQISAFNELCKKRVDLYGLIENNLAIDIKTL